MRSEVVYACITFVLALTFSLALTAGEKVFCSLCGKEISGDYIKFKDGDIFCSECMRQEKCIQCGKPTANLIKGQPICVQCAANPRVCAVCGKLLGRKFIVFPLSQQKYCAACVQKYPKCRFCSAPTQDHAAYGSRWAMCAECKARAIHGIDEYKDILSEVEALLSSNIHLQLQNPAGLEICEDIVREGRGMNGNEMGLMQQHGSVAVLLVQDGLPVEVAYETIAHEWAHAWVAQNARFKLSTETEEGFCQWVASKILLAKGFEASLDILRNRDDLYGTGYRRMEHMESSKGSNGLVEYIQSARPGLFKRMFGKRK